MDYIEFRTDLQGKPSFTNDVLTAKLSEIGFESFIEEHRIYSAYIQVPLCDEVSIRETITDIEAFSGKMEYTITNIPTKNWNAEWESNFDPVTVHDTVMVRAPFHEQNSAYKYDIVIEPKMSFGTGHHETTFLIMNEMLSMDFVGKSVADCGCGTGVLGILAAKMGAKHVFAFDYDDLCYENSRENIQRNGIDETTFDIALGGMDLLQNKQFDIILANINRNILTHNMAFIATALNMGGVLTMSGFYEKDIPVLQEYATANNLKFVSFNVKNNWSTTIFNK